LLRLSWKTAKDQLSLAPGEEEKNTLEQAIISYANSALDQLRLRFGILSKPVSDEAVRFSPEFPFSGSKTLGEFALLDQMARVDTNNLHPMTIANMPFMRLLILNRMGRSRLMKWKRVFVARSVVSGSPCMIAAQVRGISMR
jgi:hypothetical protein